MLDKALYAYAYLFGREYFRRLNWLLYRFSLSGLGVLNYQNEFISGEVVFLKKYLKGRKGALIDIGANCGNYVKMALEVNPGIRVYAFEPHPVTFEKLKNRFGGHKNVTLINKGASNQEGRLKLYDYADNDGSTHASLYEGVIKEIHASSKTVAHEVDLVSLDKFVSESGIEEIALLKIDTEGNEFNVLKGASNLISSKKIKAIHFEFNEMNAVSRVFFKDMLELLKGYRCYRLLPHGMLEITKYSPLKCEIFAYQNIVALPHE